MDHNPTDKNLQLKFLLSFLLLPLAAVMRMFA
jgi:hypothetical protein